MITNDRLQKLLRRRATIFVVDPDLHEAALSALPPALRPLYAAFNGGYVWGSALHIRPLTPVGPSPLTVAAWNEPALWKDRYLGICDDLVCFAEDVFGEQFCMRGSEIVRFNPETSDDQTLAPSLDAWLDRLLDDPDPWVGISYLDAWEEAQPPLEVGSRLIPKLPFFLGGEFQTSNFVSRDELTAMSVRVEIWEQTQGLPEGSKVVFRIVNGDGGGDE